MTGRLLSLSRTLMWVLSSFMFLGASSAFAKDIIILRNGDIIEGKLKKITVASVTIDSKRTLIEYPIKDVYGIKHSERGNTFFDRSGTRRSSKVLKEDKYADHVYLTMGGEKLLWQTAVSDGFVIGNDGWDTARNEPIVYKIPVENVFMIQYCDGSTDVLNEIPLISESATQQRVSAHDKTEKEEKEDEMKVIFHKVEKGENLTMIAEKYGIAIKELRDWNEIPGRQGNIAPLPTGSQLMIYQKMK